MDLCASLWRDRNGSMRFPQILLPTKRLNRLLASFSVRTRIVVLALVPVVGFAANGFTYVAGEGEVGTAFDTVKRADRLAGASRDFKNAVAAMRIAVKDFAANPANDQVIAYKQANVQAI